MRKLAGTLSSTLREGGEVLQNRALVFRAGLRVGRGVSIASGVQGWPGRRVARVASASRSKGRAAVIESCNWPWVDW
jgi:hypothetical protein